MPWNNFIPHPTGTEKSTERKSPPNMDHGGVVFTFVFVPFTVCTLSVMNRNYFCHHAVFKTMKQVSKQHFS